VGRYLAAVCLRLGVEVSTVLDWLKVESSDGLM
jgi:hypothetical protein